MNDVSEQHVYVKLWAYALSVEKYCLKRKQEWKASLIDRELEQLESNPFSRSPQMNWRIVKGIWPAGALRERAFSLYVL